MRDQDDLRDEFIRTVATYLITDMAQKSIFLQMGKPDAKAWAAAYQAAGCRGYATQDEAERCIRMVLGL